MNNNHIPNTKRNKNRSAANVSTMSNSNINKSHRGPNRNSSGQMSQLNYNNNAQSQLNNVSNKNSISMDNVDGVYTNKRFMHSITSLIGCLIEIKLKNGKRYEGILKTFSPQFEVVIFYAAPVVDDNEKRNSGGNIGNLLASLEKKEEIVEKLVINLKEMVHFKSANVDLDYATILKKTMLTDTEISKMDGKNVSQKELVPWNDDFLDYKDEGLEENGIAINGWNSDDMFKFNENTYNITSTYRDDMAGYTIQLEHRNDDEFRERMVKAEQISREIELDPHRQQRYSKENEADEETRFSAVVRDTDEPNLVASSNSSNNNSSKNDLNHSSRGDDRRDQLRNNTDSAGFRMANNRQNRNRTSAGRNNSSGVNDSNWREPAARMNSNRFHNQSSSYTGPSSKPVNNQMGSGGGGGGGGGGYSSKYSPSSNVTSNQYNNNNPNKTYSAVSASRHAPMQESSSNDNESKQFSNRVHVNKSDQHPNDSDSYSRRAVGLSQRDNFKRNIGPRGSDHEPNKPVATEMTKGSQPSPNLPTKELDNAKAPSLNVSSVPAPASADSPPVKPTARPDLSINQSLSKPKQNDEIKPSVETKKYDQQLNTPASTVAPPVASVSLKEQPKEVEPAKKEPVVPSASSPVASSSSTALAPVITTTPTLSTTTPPASTPIDKSPSSSEEVIKTSNLNPNAKSFTPRVSNSGSASTSPYIPSPNQVVPNQYSHQYSSQHLSTTPPTITSNQPLVAPGQYLPMHPAAAHPQHHHHQQQLHPQQPHNMGPRYNQIPFQPYGNQMIPQQMVPQHYIVQSMAPNGIPHFAGAVQSGVPAPQMPAQNGGMNSVQNGSGQMASHHMVSNPNSSGPSQGMAHNQQPQQGPQQRGPYRGKGGQNHNSSNPNQQAPQYLRQQHHIEQYNQQSQVANVTGQPIMAATAPPNPHQMSIAYSTAAAVHSHQHHHHPSQQHGQQQQNMAAQLGQPGPGQMPYAVEYQSFPGRPINLISGHPQGINLGPTLQPGLHYDPQMHAHPIYMQLVNPNVGPQMQPSIQGNPNMQPPGPGSNTSAPTIPSTPSNQIPQGSGPPQGYQ